MIGFNPSLKRGLPRAGLSAVGMLALLLGGCASQPPVRPDPAFATVLPPETSVDNPVQRNGAIYQTGQVDNMFVDSRPYRVGDILTVVLQESTNASKSAATTTGKSQTASLATPSVLGLNGLSRLSGSLSGDRSFKGDGTSSQKNSLTGQISVTVARVLSNGSLVIQGEKYLGINQGSEYVKLSGIVRPQDITPNNTVISTRIANAHIAVGGTGALNDANNMGWLARFFNSPIFPF